MILKILKMIKMNWLKNMILKYNSMEIVLSIKSMLLKLSWIIIVSVLPLIFKKMNPSSMALAEWES